MQKLALLIVTLMACAIFAEEETPTRDEELTVTSVLHPVEIANVPGDMIETVEWAVDGKTDDMLTLKLSADPVTNWFSFERMTNAPSTNHQVFKQIGLLQTNRVLTLIYEGKTNRIILKSIGREEFPSQSRTVTNLVARKK
jgi:hypothetical protein